MSEKEDKRKAAFEARRAEDARLRRAVDVVLATEEGREVFKFLFNICGWAQADVPVDKIGQVELGTLTYNATRRSIYAKLRSRATRALLTPVEEAAELLMEQPVAEENTSQQEST